MTTATCHARIEKCSVAVLVGSQNVRLYVPAGVTVHADAQIPAGHGLGFGGDIQLTGH